MSIEGTVVTMVLLFSFVTALCTTRRRSLRSPATDRSMAAFDTLLALLFAVAFFLLGSLITYVVFAYPS